MNFQVEEKHKVTYQVWFTRCDRSHIVKSKKGLTREDAAVRRAKMPADGVFTGVALFLPLNLRIALCIPKLFVEVGKVGGLRRVTGLRTDRYNNTSWQMATGL